MPVNASPGDHLVMGNHRAQYTRSGWALLEQRASLNLPLGPVRRGKVSRGNAVPGREVLKASEQALAPPARQKHKH